LNVAIRHSVLYCILLVVSVLVVPNFAFSQNFGNEWIVSGQEYIKISTLQTGIHYVSGQDLANAGISSTNWNPSTIQLWHRGEQVSIALKGMDDGTFDLQDSVVFYGSRNDGTLDSLLYKPTSSQPHKYYNLHSDTCVYFLTSGSFPGKRIQSISHSQSGTQTTWHWKNELLVYTQSYSRGTLINDTRSSDFTFGEGWTGAVISKAATALPINRTFDVPLTNFLNNGPNVQLEILLTGMNDEIHHVNVIVGDLANPIGSLPVEIFSGISNRKFFTYVPSNLILGTSLKVTVQVKGSSSYTDRVAVSYIKVEYPQSVNLNTVQNQVLKFENSISSNLAVPLGLNVYDITNKKNVRQFEVASGEIMLPAGNTEILVSPKTLLQSPVKMQKVSLGKFSGLPASANYFIISHPRFENQAKDYANYRASPVGGGYMTQVAMINDLYNEFSYGEFTPLAVRNYCQYIATNANPKYLFIIGRGLDVDYNHYRVNKWYRTNPEAYQAENTWDYVNNFVPYSGNPTSDLNYVNGLKGNPDFLAAFPVGRLNAKYPAEVTAYLNKVRTHEALPQDQLWRKNLLHLSGGKTQNEIQYFYKVLQQAEIIAEDTVFGGKVTKHISKKAGSYVEDKLIETVAEQVNKGVSYVTFMGHDSPNVPDIDIGYVSNTLYGYTNYGKYPMLFLNGCNTTNGLVPYSLPENWLQTDNLGAILSLGHTDLAYIPLLERYMKLFYKHAFTNREVYENNLSVGDIQLLVHKELDTVGNVYLKSMQQQVFLMGDPAIRMYSPRYPDFAITNAFITSYNNLPVSAISDSFNLKVVVDNYGISYSQPIRISINRQVGTKVFQDTLSVVLPIYSDTISINVKNHNAEDIQGINRFTITIDPYQNVQESNKNNNQYTLRHFFPSSTVLPLLPQKYSIVNKSTINLIAQSNDLMLENASYVFEIDTSYTFSSPIKTMHQQNSGALATWRNVTLPGLGMKDSLVYFWRVRFAQIPTEGDTVWGQSSFVYIKNGQEGWSQSALPQIQEGVLQGITIDLNSNSLSFSNLFATISAASTGKSYVGPDKTQPAIYYTDLGINGDGIVFENRGGCGEGLLAITLDKSDLVPYFPLKLNNVCGQDFSGKRINSFTKLAQTTDVSSGQYDLIRYLDAVKTGDYVLLVSSGNSNFDKWLPALKSKVVSVLGAQYLDSLKANMPYIILGRKDSANPIFENYGQVNEIIRYTDELAGKELNGTIESPVIGPTSQWQNVSYSINTTAGDEYKINLVGIDKDGKETLLYNNIQLNPLDISNLDSRKFPFLKLVAELYDSTYLTTPFLNHWTINYQNAPEGTMDPVVAGLEQYKSSAKQEGDSIALTYVFTNISEKDFTDTLEVLYTIKNYTNGQTKRDTIKLADLKVGQSLQFKYKLNTIGWSGDNTISAYVNPEILPEMYYNNNIIESDFTVTTDKINPILDVTFDGVHLMDGDIVSPNPMIAILLRDENQFQIRNDTMGIDLFLKRPCAGCQYEKINFTDPAIHFYGQANAKSNNFKIDYRPGVLEDGMYTLRVQGKDMSGNKSGLQPYEINFEVINESSITNFYPYPNPFSSSTRFVFTLTGSKIPEDIMINIMTVTGKVVRQIRKAELGPLRIGNNLTEYAWDGRDEFGDQLANGVYLYQVKIKGDDEYKHRKTSADKAFKKGFGKIYLLK